MAVLILCKKSVMFRMTGPRAIKWGDSLGDTYIGTREDLRPTGCCLHKLSRYQACARTDKLVFAIGTESELKCSAGL